MNTKVFCRDCKHLEYLGFYEGEEVTTCELGRYLEHNYAENNNWLTICKYWESKGNG